MRHSARLYLTAVLADASRFGAAVFDRDSNTVDCVEASDTATPLNFRFTTLSCLRGRAEPSDASSVEG